MTICNLYLHLHVCISLYLEKKNEKMKKFRTRILLLTKCCCRCCCCCCCNVNKAGFFLVTKENARQRGVIDSRSTAADTIIDFLRCIILFIIRYYVHELLGGYSSKIEKNDDASSK
jgi:hypothetical protein